jgi:hypothetical protein
LSIGWKAEWRTGEGLEWFVLPTITFMRGPDSSFVVGFEWLRFECYAYVELTIE